MSQSAHIPEVTVDESYATLRQYGREILGMKYIVANVGDQRVVWANNADANMHKHLVASLEKIVGHEIECLGGGSLYLNRKEKKIHLWDYSADYGRDDKRLTAKMLEEHFQGYVVVFYAPGDKPLLDDEE